MLYCNEHQQKGVAYAGGGGPCVECGHDAEPPGKLCDACSLKLDQCAVCRVCVHSGRPARMVASIAAAERKRDRAVARAEKIYARISAPLRPHAEAHQTTQIAIADEYRAIERQFAQLEQASRDAYSALRTAEANKVGVEEASARFAQAKAAYLDAVKEPQAIRDAKFADNDKRFAPYKAAWEACERAHRNATWRAERLFAARIAQLGGHVAVNIGYRCECNRVISQSK